MQELIKQLRLETLAAFKILMNMLPQLKGAIGLIDELENSIKENHTILRNIHTEIEKQMEEEDKEMLLPFIHLDYKLLQLSHAIEKTEALAADKLLQKAFDILLKTLQSQSNNTYAIIDTFNLFYKNLNIKEITFKEKPAKSRMSSPKAHIYKILEERKKEQKDDFTRGIFESKKVIDDKENDSDDDDHPWIFKISPKAQESSSEAHKTEIARKQQLARDCEIVYQEFSRLINSIHPKLRHAINHETKEPGVASKKINDLLHVDETKIAERIRKNELSGLGVVTVLAMTLNNADLRFKNLCQVGTRIINIDGDCGFYGLQNQEFDLNFGFTSDDITSLPYLTNCKPYNWLNQWFQSKAPGIGTKIPETKLFRDEVNLTILQLILLPNAYLTAFVNHFSSQTNQEAICDQLVGNIGQLREAALMNPSFKTFLLTDLAETELKKYISHVKYFVGINKHRIAENDSTLQTKMHSKFTKYRKRVDAAEKIPASTLKHSKTQLLFKDFAAIALDEELELSASP